MANDRFPGKTESTLGTCIHWVLRLGRVRDVRGPAACRSLPAGFDSGQLKRLSGIPRCFLHACLSDWLNKRSYSPGCCSLA